jgi:hypothetical protein
MLVTIRSASLPITPRATPIPPPDPGPVTAPATTGPVAAEPSDDCLVAVLAAMSREGFRGDLRAREGRVVCSTCQSVLAPHDLLVHRLHRLEGASDPADMLAVVGATCRGCGTDGALVLGYGPRAGVDDAMVLARLDIPDEVGSPDLR